MEQRTSLSVSLFLSLSLSVFCPSHSHTSYNPPPPPSPLPPPPQGGLVGLVFAASKLDGIIAKAQVKGFEEDRNQTWRVQKPTKGDGNIFIVPEDDK